MKFILKFGKDCSASPRAWCEVCNTKITDARMAIVYWRFSDYKQELHSPLLVHKGCMNAARSREEEYDCSMELWTYLVFLLQNTGLTGTKLTDAFQNADLLRSID